MMKSIRQMMAIITYKGVYNNLYHYVKSIIMKLLEEKHLNEVRG